MIQTDKTWIFVSDAHFRKGDSEAMMDFLTFLNSEIERIGNLVILGDLFEFLFGFQRKHTEEQRFFPFPDYLPILEALQRLYRRGVQIKYFEGNHDFNLRSFFSERFDMDIEVFPESHEETLGPRRAFIAHGDLSNPKLWRYRLFRRIIKHPWTYALIERVGPNISCRVARWLSRRSYQKNHSHPLQGAPPEFQYFAHQKFLEGFDIVILGHSHFPEEVEEYIEGRTCRYFNVGDWREHRSFLRFTPPDKFELGSWGGK